MEPKPGTYKMGRCLVIVSIDNGRWHMSISTRIASPSYQEIKKARYLFIPDKAVMAQLFPPSAEFINLHPYCHHLWEIKAEDIEAFTSQEDRKSKE